MKEKLRALFCFRERMLADRADDPRVVAYMLAVKRKRQR
jgi:hypothetical protein